MPRNSSGTYTLPAGNPVVANTLIETNWANPTMSDLGAALTDSLDRNGRGAMLAPLLLAGGAVAAPGLSFSAESSSGLYRPSAAVIGMSVAGVERARWTTTGMGITGVATITGATTISGSLTVAGVMLGAAGTVGAPGFAFSGDADSGLWNPAADTVGMSTAGGERQRWTTSGTSITGNLGVSGNTALTGTLTVGGASVVPGSYVLKAGDTMTGALVNTADMGLRNDTANGTRAALRLFQSGQEAWTIENPASQTYLRIAASGAELLRVLNTGRVGIGATDPRQHVEVGGTINAEVWLKISNDSAFNTQMRGIQFGLRADNTNYGSLGMNLNSGEVRLTAGFGGWGGFQTFFTNGTERFRIGSAGEARIVNSTFAELYFSSGVSGSGSGAVSVDIANNAMRFFTNGAERMRIDASGNVGIGTATPDARLGLGAGEARLHFDRASFASIFCSLKHNGDSGGVEIANINSSVDRGITFSRGTSYAGRTTAFRIESDGRLYGTALHNNAGSVTGTTNQYIASGTYTPTLTAGLNVESVSNFAWQWIRIGNVVHVAGAVNLDPISAGDTYTRLGLSLPIASNLSVAGQLSGTGMSNTGEEGWCQEDIANVRCQYDYWSTGTSARRINISFTYVIL